jgi:hypothetical protein
MAPRANPQMSPQQVAQQNAGLRAALLQSAPRMRKNVLTATAGTSQTTRLKLFNVGVLTKLLLRVTADITIGAAIAVPSAKAPWNLISRVRLTDYDGQDRVNLSGFQLWVINSVRQGAPYGFNNMTAAITAVFTNPQVPTAIGAGTIAFFIEIPVAFDVDNPIVQLQDLRGAIMSQTAVGEMYLNIDWTNSLYTNNDVDSVYAGAGATTVVGASSAYITVTMWQDYLMPQAIGPGGAIPLPGIDLMTVYELVGNVRSNDNLANGTQKLINYPNVRSVIGAYVNFVNGGALVNTISAVQLIANGNNILMDNTSLSQLFVQRQRLENDLAAGVYFLLHRDHPVETALFGNVQLGMTPNAAITGSNYMELGFESFYTKGAALPGIGQAS